MHVVIIGAVAAGMSTASKLKRLDPAINITVYERGEDVSYGACGLPYFLSGIIKEEGQLIARKPAAFREEGIDLHVQHEVIAVDTKAKVVTVKRHDTQETFSQAYDALVVATGASPMRLPIETGGFKNIHTLGSLADGRRLKAALEQPQIKRVAVVGAGYIGLEIVENLHEMGKEVILIEREERVLAAFEPFIAKRLLVCLHDHHITVKTGETVVSYNLKAGGAMLKTDKQEYPVDLVIEAIGVRPATQFLKGTAIKTLDNGAIVTDSRLRTSIPDVYAAGDCAAYVHRITGVSDAYIPLGTHANKAGRIIALQLAGMDHQFAGVLGSGVLKVFDYEVARTGFGQESALKNGYNVGVAAITAQDRAGYYPGAVPIDIEVYYDQDSCRLLGAQMIGTSGVAHRINTMAVALASHLTAEQFAGLDFAYAPPFSPVYDPLLVAVNQIKCSQTNREES